ncbi:hypothetical protein MKX03_006926, partial [Papaver bracteatum]
LAAKLKRSPTAKETDDATHKKRKVTKNPWTIGMTPLVNDLFVNLSNWRA